MGKFEVFGEGEINHKKDGTLGPRRKGRDLNGTPSTQKQVGGLDPHSTQYPQKF